MNPETRTYDKHWMPWIREQLMARGIQTYAPHMPEPWQPNYEKYTQELEKYPITENTILMGHSCGCAFLVRWLGETQRSVAKLILVAPWKIWPAGDTIKQAFYSYPIDPTIKSRVRDIIIFTADNEEVEGKESVEIFQQALGGEIIELKGRGHYIGEENSKIPELLAAALRT